MTNDASKIDWHKFNYISDSILKDKRELFEEWFNRKIKEQFKVKCGGMDEQGTDRKEGAQSPKPLF